MFDTGRDKQHVAGIELTHLRAAAESAGALLHGSQTTLDDITFYGLGGGIPITPFGAWSYDFSEDEAKNLLQDIQPGGVLISHSPPKGILDMSSDGRSLGSEAVREITRH